MLYRLSDKKGQSVMAILGYSIKVHDKALKTVFPFSVLFGFFFFFIFYFLFFLLIFSKIK